MTASRDGFEMLSFSVMQSAFCFSNVEILAVQLVVGTICKLLLVVTQPERNGSTPSVPLSFFVGIFDEIR